MPSKKKEEQNTKDEAIERTQIPETDTPVEVQSVKDVKNLLGQAKELAKIVGQPLNVGIHGAISLKDLGININYEAGFCIGCSGCSGCSSCSGCSGCGGCSSCAGASGAMLEELFGREVATALQDPAIINIVKEAIAIGKK